MARGLGREVKVILSKLEKQGWEITLRNGHYRCYNPATKSLVFNGSTPSDPRGLKNFVSQLRRAGAKL
jgi:hypothetical protein